MKQVTHNIYRIPSAWEPACTQPANRYLVRGEGRSLLIDSGFCSAGSFASLEQVRRQCGIPWEELDVFLTHNHPDHAGLAQACSQRGARILMNPQEQETCALLCRYLERSQESVALLRGYGFSQSQAQLVLQRSLVPAYRYHDYPWHGFPVVEISEGERLRYGGYDFAALSLAGHTRHQMGLVEREHRWLFTGDTLGRRQVMTLACEEPGSYLLYHHQQTLERLSEEFGNFWVVPGHGRPFYGTRKAVENARRYFSHMLNKVRAAMGVSGAWTLVRVVEAVFGYAPGGLAQEEVLRLHFRLSNVLCCLDEWERQGAISRTVESGVWLWQA